jgi:hypothetical protein
MPFSPPRWLRVIILDVLGVLMLIGAVLFGWLPGPGGIPLLFGGLGLLAMNHAWAKRLLNHVKVHGMNFMEQFFNTHPLIQWLYDIVGLGLIGLAIWLLNSFTRNLIQSLAIAVGFTGLGLLLGNRRRLQNFTKRLKKALPFK